MSAAVWNYWPTVENESIESNFWANLSVGTFADSTATTSEGLRSSSLIGKSLDWSGNWRVCSYWNSCPRWRLFNEFFLTFCCCAILYPLLNTISATWKSVKWRFPWGFTGGWIMRPGSHVGVYLHFRSIALSLWLYGPILGYFDQIWFPSSPIKDGRVCFKTIFIQYMQRRKVIQQLATA